MVEYVPRVGVICLGDPREEVPWREEEERKYEVLVGRLGECGDFVLVPFSRVVRSYGEGVEAVDYFLKERVDVVLMYVPVWTFPSIAVRIGRRVKDVSIPLIILYTDRILSGILAISGSFKQVGVPHRIVYGSLEEVVGDIRVFARACMVVSRLRGMVYGVFGGRALGMYTTVADSALWERKFGIDVEHVDQLEIMREVERVSEEDVGKYLRWVEENFGGIEYDGKVLTREKLERQIRVYLALKRLVKKYGFDFIGIKCQPELSDYYVDACLAVALMNDPYDADGSKEPIVCACEVDHDGALTMQILKIVSGGKPATLMDVLVYDESKNLLFLANCGGMATYFTKRSKDARENLKHVYLKPQVQGKAGGAATQYVADEGVFTIARMFREDGEYKMVLMKAEAVKVPLEELKKSVEVWPHIVVRISRDKFRRLIEVLGANHLHAVEGDYVRELEEFCRLMGIECILLD